MFGADLGQNSTLGFYLSSPINFTPTFIILKTLWLSLFRFLLHSISAWRCTAVPSTAENALFSGAALHSPSWRQTCTWSREGGSVRRWEKWHQNEPSSVKVDMKWNSTKCSELRKHRSWLPWAYSPAEFIVFLSPSVCHFIVLYRFVHTGNVLEK